MPTETFYTATIVVAPGKCVPRPNDREATRKHYAALAKSAASTRPMFISFTEAWYRECRDGIRDGLPEGYHLIAPLGNSAILAYDVRQVYLDRPTGGSQLKGSLLLHGVVAGKGWVASDPRRMPWGQFIIRKTGGRKLRAGAYHPTPIKPKEGATAVKVMESAQTKARAVANRFMDAEPYPSAVFGDCNDASPALGDRTVGSRTDKIVRVAVNNSLHVGFGKLTVVEYDQPAHFDHKGLRFSAPVHSL